VVSVRRGDVRWFEHPDAGRRPVLVLTRQAAIPVLSSVTVAMITTTIRGIPTEVPLDARDGMPRDCAVSLDNLATVPVSLLPDRVTTLSGDRMAQVCLALARATGCAA
jgi:mRNA interferase MazF